MCTIAIGEEADVGLPPGNGIMIVLRGDLRFVIQEYHEFHTNVTGRSD